MDELGKVLLAVSIMMYICGGLTRNTVLQMLSVAGCVVFLYRFFSSQTFDRSEENCRFLRYIKLWRLKFEQRKTARIYMCPQCGKMIRVPKGRGKIQISCPKCRNKIIRRT
jgi:DNA-directed RNA polymerase subunit RPC12/RpoP